MIVFADLHLKEDSEKTVFEQVFPGIFHAASHDPDKTIAFLGDFWHTRYRIPVHLQNKVAEFLRALQKSGIAFIMLPGNHDQIDVEGENALEVFADYPNVYVYTEPTIDEYGLWIPYRKRPEDILEALTEGKKNLGEVKPILWMHHGIQGAKMNNNLFNSHGLPVEHFQNWLVFCGHYHIRQTLGTIRYVGSPYQTKADEAGQDKGYGIWNPKTFNFEYVTMDWGKRYHNLGKVDVASLDMSQFKPGDEIRAVAAAGTDATQLGRILEKSGGQVLVTPELAEQTARLQVGGQAGLADYAMEYVKEFHGELPEDRLVSVYKMLCNG